MLNPDNKEEFFQGLNSEIRRLRKGKGSRENIKVQRKTLLSAYLRFLKIPEEKVQELIESKNVRYYILGYLHQLVYST